MRDEDIPDINNPKTMKAVLEGDKLMRRLKDLIKNIIRIPLTSSSTQLSYDPKTTDGSSRRVLCFQAGLKAGGKAERPSGW